ncbi:hypothetical protein Tco_0996784 [Tanacetum coccineum]
MVKFYMMKKLNIFGRYRFTEVKPHKLSVPTMPLFRPNGFRKKTKKCNDSDCDELNTVKVALMANLSHYGSDVLAEVYNPDNMDNNMINQDVQARPSSEQFPQLTNNNNNLNFPN